MERSRENLAWAAGLFEGEGCFSVQARQHVPFANLGTTDLDVLERFHTIVGFGAIYPFTRTSPRAGGPAWKDGAQWRTTTFEQMQATVALLWPWLGERRRARARELLLAERGRQTALQRGQWGGHRSLAGEWFGKRARDLTPSERQQYWRLRSARLRAQRAEADEHRPATGRNRRRA